MGEKVRDAGGRSARRWLIAVLLCAAVGLRPRETRANDPLTIPGESCEFEADQAPWYESRESCCGVYSDGTDTSQPWFTLRANALILHRTAVQSHVLLTDAGTGRTLLTTSDADPGWAGGPEFDFLLHAAPTTDLEFNWFSLEDWAARYSADLTGGVVNPIGAALTGASVSVSSRLRNLEVNVRQRAFDSVTLLAGFRYVELRDATEVRFEESTAGRWQDVQVGVTNRLWGFQVGGNASLWNWNGLAIDGWLKAGIYGNAARHSMDETSVGFAPLAATLRAGQSRTAFVGDLGVRGTWQFGQHTTAFVGYRLMYLDGVGLAANQYDRIVSFFNGGPPGMTTDGSLLLMGIEAGVAFAF